MEGRDLNLLMQKMSHLAGHVSAAWFIAQSNGLATCKLVCSFLIFLFEPCQTKCFGKDTIKQQSCSADREFPVLSYVKREGTLLG